MCGRFSQALSPEDLERWFDLDERPRHAPRYNVAPGQAAGAVRQRSPQGPRCLDSLRWGLVPGWAREPRTGYKMINARAETAAGRPAFRVAMRYRRCIVPADGYYEWSHHARVRQPHHIRRADGRPIGLAGIWEHWEGPEGEVLETFAVLTTGASEWLQPIHDRMPVILRPEDYDRWLDPALQQPRALQGLLGPYPDPVLQPHPVSTYVNDPRHDDPRCLAPAE